MKRKQAVETRRGRPPRAPGREAPSSAAPDREEQQERSPWRVVRGGAALMRSYAFPNPAVAASFSQLAVGLAAHAKVPLFVRQMESTVTLALRGDGDRQLRPLAAELFDSLASLS